MNTVTTYLIKVINKNGLVSYMSDSIAFNHPKDAQEFSSLDEVSEEIKLLALLSNRQLKFSVVEKTSTFKDI